MAVILGILGSRNGLTKQILQDEILNPVLDDIGGKIDRILLPADSLSSTFIECWANRKDIPCATIKSDFINYGRKASVLRDARIEKESTCFIVFEGPRSQYYMNKATQIAKRYSERRVYLVNAKGVTPELLEIEAPRGLEVSDEKEAQLLQKPSAAVQTLKDMWGGHAAQKCLLVDD